MAERAAILRAWAETRRALASVRSRAALERRQARLWQRLAPAIAATPALSACAGKPLSACPLTRVGDLRADFERWNSRGIREVDARAAAEAAERGGAVLLADGIAAGLSTGTVGTRGLFLADREERARYVGQALARLLPAHALLTGKRIALCLRADNALYRDVGAAGRFAFRFIPLSLPAEQRADALARFDPDVLIAPPHILAELARAGTRLPALERLFYGAEPMGDGERLWIADRIGVRPDPIYQATEGFLGAPCHWGTLHLNEHDMVIELSELPGTGRFVPVVTDLRHATQPIVRVALDDLIEPLAAPCPCGSIARAIRPVEGRASDLWRWHGVAICPRTVDDAMTAALGAAADWRAMASRAAVVVEADDKVAAIAALETLLTANRIAVPVTARSFTGYGDSPKRRRVRWMADDD